eukprot:GILK01002976.1.p1 GENE.GILK01002976.1~~GILK01002976.1.p1  ORF type:complete len:630 (-),score=140.07 GILK01002976.1:137-2026(-)
MVVYNFKKIQIVPPASEFIDIILSKTQRKTPTVVHPGYKISRIRNFYMRKVKYTQTNYHEKLTQILEDFPRLDDIHPFYADLMNVLYDKDHYKLALGHIHSAKQLVDDVGKDYVRLLKYADSLYRCKMLKRAALGRMCTVIKKLSASLSYLEEVRKHLARLPSIDPNTRTLLVTGYPNVGKSSFMNKMTRANVEVQPYAFTTKSLFVGHMDYKYVRWQVIDTPGILDHPLEDRNTIEMQSITALAHLHACVLYFVDISENCGYTIKQQISLFNSIKPLFANKPLLLIANKIDIKPFSALAEDDRLALEALCNDIGTQFMQMSNMTEEGVSDVKSKACDMLLEHRNEVKHRSSKAQGILNRLHQAVPVPRDNKQRPANIPVTVAQGVTLEDMGMKTEKELQEMEGGAGVFAADFRKRYLLSDEDWKYDVVPEIMDGKNIADFVDADILRKIEELEKEEAEFEAEMEKEMMEDGPDDIDQETRDKVQAVRDKKKMAIQQSRLKKSRNAQVVSGKRKKLSEVESHLQGMGIDPATIRSRSRSRTTRTTDRMESEGPETRSLSRARGRSKTPARDESGIVDPKEKARSISIARKARKDKNRHGKRGEGDREIAVKLPKHLYAGKRGGGKTDWR